MRIVLVCMIAMLSIACVFAQDEELQSNRIMLETRVNAFGIEETVLVGNIVNAGDMAYENVQVFGDILDDDEVVIGELFGFLVDQCGEAITDSPLQPGQSRQFLATVDLFDEGTPERFELFPQGMTVEPEDAPQRDIAEAITQVAMGEVVRVEWEDETTLRYAIGCDEDLFTSYDWYRYNLESSIITPLDENPNAQYITESFIQQTGINMITQGNGFDETLINRSYLTFPTQSSRIVYQTDINTVLTAEVDGSFKRVIHTVLSQFSLQGFVWSPLGNFVATYFGAYGEPVQYFTASSSQSLISALLPNNTPSVTIPGLTDDGRSVIIGGTFADNNDDEVTGYWLSSAITQQRELLYAVDELPGNNYPAPAYYRQDANTRYIYTIRPIEDVPTLECFYREESELTTLSELPLQLDTDERAWSFLSPDNGYLAIASNGDHGGLWLVDLNTLDTCRNSS
ncbi:MAG: hypothetical protein ACFE0Q_11180 [Anaerolineae bacterium]